MTTDHRWTITVRDALDGALHHTFRHLPAGLPDPGDLFGWDDLARILTDHQLEAPRLQLARHGALVPPATYTRPVTLRPGVVHHQLRPHLLNSELDNGATLALDAVDHCHHRLRRVAHHLEAAFATGVLVTAYASRTPAPGFNRHTDQTDVLVLQLDGSKHWEIHPPTGGAEPTTNATEIVLTPGDVLYLPRGWWHAVTAHAGPSLHLTCALTPHTVLDLLQWLATQPVGAPLRADLPAPRQALPDLVPLLKDPEVVARYRAAQDKALHARPAIDLPTPDERYDKFTQVALVPSRSRLVRHDDGETALHADGDTWPTVPPKRLPVLTALLGQRDTTIGDLAAATGLSVAQVAADVRHLVRHGLAATR
ncbi:cupin domain-containing protein [Kitasatospora aureofaciens]|uniref:JmjC domain-containing protein n=1 Tax=Kitasatospora aureofaciens TaxID=1894 RepID=UPI001C479F18|nr:cupin domain-containing protein [Kitasatospora aureofaciens]MBV6700285.1 cupin domain-containing protein [Kitasatospora aureofaciens]